MATIHSWDTNVPNPNPNPKGKLTYFYNGENLRDGNEWRLYDEEERKKWKVIMILPRVEIIPRDTFKGCVNVETVIMSDTVTRVKYDAFCDCRKLEFIRLSKNIEYIGPWAFSCCTSLISIFIPESCREIHKGAFYGCFKMIILTVPRHTTLRDRVIGDTALSKAFPIKTDVNGGLGNRAYNDEVNEWIKNLNQGEELDLHRECTSIEPPSEDGIYEIIKHQGLPSIHIKNQIGVTALQYLQKNPYTENQIDQHKLMKRLVLDLMGEIIPSFDKEIA